MEFKVLVIEDAEESKDLIYKALGSSFDLVWAQTINGANELLKTNKCDIVLLDVGLPDGDGFHFFSMFKNNEDFKNIPVIFLTARDSDSDKVLGISMGAEDYIIKPFSSAELKARVEMRLKKIRGKKEQVIRSGGLEVYLTEQRVFLKNLEAKVDLQLTPLEFKVLVLLLSHEEQVFSRDQLLTQIWGENTFLTDRCVDTHIYSLRKKLGKAAHLIQSVYGEGYRFSLKENDELQDLKKVS